MEPMLINLFYYNEDVPLFKADGTPFLAHNLYETIQTIFSTAIIKNKDHSYEIPLKWNFRLIPPKTSTEIQCDILAFFQLALNVGRPDNEHKAQVLESGVTAGCLMKSGALLFLNVMSGGVNLEEYARRTAYGQSDFFTKKEYSEKLKKFPFNGCSINVIGDVEVIKKNIESDLVQNKKTSVYQHNMPEIKLMIDDVIQKKFDNMTQEEKEKYIKPPIPEGTKSSPQPAMQPKVNSKLDDKAEAFVKWKDENPEIAKYLPNETASERYKRLWPLFNKSRESLVPNIAPSQVQRVVPAVKLEKPDHPRVLPKQKQPIEPLTESQANPQTIPEKPNTPAEPPIKSLKSAVKKESSQLAAQSSLTSKPSEVKEMPIQAQPPVPPTAPIPGPVPLLLQAGTKSSPQPAMQPKVNSKLDDKAEAFVKWKDENPEIAKYLPNETASERYKRLWPLFNKSREILVPNIAPIQVQPSVSQVAPEPEPVPLLQPVARGRFVALKNFFSEIGKGFKAIGRILATPFIWFGSWIRSKFARQA